MPRPGRRPGAGRRRARLLHLRHGPVERHALARRAQRRPRGHRARDEHRQRPPRVPQRRPRVRRRQRAPAAWRSSTSAGPGPRRTCGMFSGRIAEVTCPRIAVLGTDGAIGKRTTATILTQALNDRGIKAVMVGTGQTGLIQGARYGVALDAIPSPVLLGRDGVDGRRGLRGRGPRRDHRRGPGRAQPPRLPDLHVHPARQPARTPSSSSTPRRARRLGDFADLPMPTPASEINLIETFADTKVIGLTINHENMTDAEVTRRHHPLRARARHPRHRCPDPLARAPGRHGARRLPRARARSSPPASDDRAAARDRPRPRSRHNARTLVERLGRRGIAVTGVTKATLGSPEIARRAAPTPASPASATRGSRTSRPCGGRASPRR